MDRVLSCLTEEHDLRLVVLAGLLCLIACYTAFGLIARAQQSRAPRARLLWTVTSATVAGFGVWATHFVAMLAFETGLPLGYDLGATATSVVIAVAMMAAGIALATAAAEWRVAGGVVVGLAIGAMHFVGMAAVRAPARLEYDGAYVVVAIALGATLAPAAMRAGLRGVGPGRRAGAAGLLTVAICGLHFVAMAAVRLVPDPRIPLPDHAVIEPEWLAIAVAAAALAIIALGLVGALLDEHLAGRSEREAERLRKHVAELEATKGQLEATAVELKAALKAAAEASEAKSQFLATMSHELRTPMNAILGFADLIAADSAAAGAAERNRDFAEEIGRSGRQLLGLINNILDFSRLQSGHIELSGDAVDLEMAIEDAVEAARPAAEAAGLTLTAEIEPGLPPLWADARRLRQVLQHLLSNAVKFTAAGGAVRVRGARHGDGLAISVSDTGMGIEATMIDDAFEQFRQLDGALNRKREGAGLGLPLSRKLVELHGGTLRIESAGEGKGATATVLLPRRSPKIDGEDAERRAA